MQVTIYHNPKCSKSRHTLALLEERGIEPEVIDYLQNPPDAARLGELLRMLGYKPRELMRTKESLYAELDLARTVLSEDELIDAMATNPILIERPIVVVDGRAAIGRPPEKVVSLLDG